MASAAEQPELFDVAWEARERFRALASFTAAKEAAKKGRCVIAAAHFADGVRFEGRQEMAAARGERNRLATEPSLEYHNALDMLLSRCLCERK